MYILILLGEAGADVNVRTTPHSMTPLLTLMLDGFDPGSFGSGGFATGRFDIGGIRSVAKKLTHAGADLDAQDSSGFTAVTWCARRPSLPVLETLLELGARSDLADEDGNTAATHAFCRSLITSDAKLRQEYKKIRRAIGGPVAHQLDVELLAAAFKGDEKRCRLLLQKGADPTYRYEGWEAMRYAQVGGHQSIIDLLDG